jgi:hypothetical protein
MKGRNLYLMSLMVLALAASSYAQTTVCIPQFVDGESDAVRWRTTLILMNQEQTQAQVQLQFYDNEGAPIRQLQMTRAHGQGPVQGTDANGQFSPSPIQARSMVALQSNAQGGLKAGYVMVQSQQRIQVQTRLQLTDQAGNLMAEVGVTPGPQFRMGSFYAGTSEGALIGMSLTNPSLDQTVTVSVEVVSEDGTVLGTTDITLGPHSQIAKFLFELFPQLLTDEGVFVRITSPDPICALVLNLHGFEMFQIPVFVIDPE